MFLLLQSYYFGLSEISICGVGSNETAIERSLEIVVQRYPLHFLCELKFITLNMSLISLIL